jgi:hypothetical protein
MLEKVVMTRGILPLTKFHNFSGLDQHDNSDLIGNAHGRVLVYDILEESSLEKSGSLLPKAWGMTFLVYRLELREDLSETRWQALAGTKDMVQETVS